MKKAFTGGTVITGRPEDAPRRADVVVEDGGIVEIAPGAGAQAQERVDCSGRYIVPGLINLHAHLFGTGKPSKALGGGGSQRMLLRLIRTAPGRRALERMVAQHVRAELESGVTTLRSVGDFLGSDLRVRDAVRAGKLPGPRMYCSGTAITVPGGHGDGTFAQTASRPEDLVRLVEEHHRAGVDLIKICVTGGVMDATKKGSPGELKMSLEQTRAVCERAHQLGLKVASHTESPAGMEVAVRGGVDTIEHSAGFTGELQEILRERGGGIVATFSPALPLARLDPAVTKLNELCVYNSEVVLEGMCQGIRDAEQAGIPVGLGTDASCPFATQYNMWREVWYYWKIMGITPQRALYAATLANAGILGVDKLTGSVEVGKRADLIVLDRDPLADLTALRDPRAVVKDGEVYTPRVRRIPAVERELDALCAAL